jgi:hypothetical protein
MLKHAVVADFKNVLDISGIGSGCRVGASPALKATSAGGFTQAFTIGYTIFR